MPPKHHLSTILLFAIFLFASCSSNRYVIYSVVNVVPAEAEKTIPINVNVKTLTDNRKYIKNNEVLFSTNFRKTIINKNLFCINAEKGYRINKETVATQVTQMMVKHFNKAKLFANTNFNNELSCDYYLTGTLNILYGEQELSADVEAGVIAGVVGGILFGVVGGAIGGALASSTNTKSPGKIIIEISDINLFRKDGLLIQNFGSFYKEYEGIFPADLKCKCVYENVNAKLRDFNAELIEKLRMELLEININP